MKDPVQALYDALDAEGIEEVRAHTAPPRRFRASEASKCVRETYHRLNGDRPAPRKGRNYMYGVLGDVDHDISRQLLNHHGIPVGGVTFTEEGEGVESMFYRKTYEVEQAGRVIPIELTCRADGQIMTPRGDAVLEIKGMGFYPYDWLNKAYVKGGHEAALARVHEKHKSYIYQTQVTMALSGYKLCYLLVKDRSSGTLGLHNQETDERTGIYIEYDEDLFQAILQRFAYIKRKLDDGEPPQPEYSSGARECSWCPFNYLCHGAAERRQRGIEPAVLYPGPQFEEYNEQRAVQRTDGPAGAARRRF